MKNNIYSISLFRFLLLLWRLFIYDIISLLFRYFHYLPVIQRRFAAVHTRPAVEYGALFLAQKCIFFCGKYMIVWAKNKRIFIAYSANGSHLASCTTALNRSLTNQSSLSSGWSNGRTKKWDGHVPIAALVPH